MCKVLQLVGLSLFALAGVSGVAHAENPTEVWKGSYSNTKGGKNENSTITFSEKGLSFGDWDGYEISHREDQGKTRRWLHYTLANGKYTNVYFVSATIKGDTMTVTYDVWDSWLIILGEPSGVPEKTSKLLYSGSGTFTRSK